MSLVYESPKLKIETKPVHLPNGKDREYLFVQPVSAVCILPTDDTSVYLIRQYRAVIDEYILEVPAGGMDNPSESPLECAIRELGEEMQLKAQKYIPRGSIYSTPGFCTEKLWLFEAQGLSPRTDLKKDEDEIIDTVKIPKNKIFSMINNGDINDAKTIALITRCFSQKIRGD